MNRILRISAGFVVGASLAAGLVLLLTPRSGAETQQAIKDQIQAILEEGQLAAEERRLELTAQLEALKQPVPRA
jgi:gas vesicle protein